VIRSLGFLFLENLCRCTLASYNARFYSSRVLRPLSISPSTNPTASALDSFLAGHRHLQTQVIGQEHLVQRMLMTLLCGGHLLVEGAPGLAKTRAIKCLSAIIEGDFHRIQFTPDLLPSDVTGTEIYRPEDTSFVFQQGPIFHNLVLADEINRAPAKVQSALLEAMAEGQVSFGRQTFPLPELFMVMATQNPIEQEGTYALPEAQLDRFLLQVIVDYPQRQAELDILQLVRSEAMSDTELDSTNQPTLISQKQVKEARQEMLGLHMAEPVERYLVELVLASRTPPADLAPYLELGASPRATIGLDLCARATAWLDGRTFVTPEDVQAVAHDVLRHRLIRSFEADAQGISNDALIESLLECVPVP
jgi:MoxR-like ATPase